MSKFNVGDKVRYIGKDHREMPEFYPEIGTIGTVVKEGGGTDWSIQWSKGSTSGKDCWYCDENDIELVKDEDMTNEEIWEMLKPKMEKNGLSAYMFSIPTLENIEGDIKWTEDQVYKDNDVHNAIALAYKVGYLRAMKGRPFKFGKKKKKGGHWEPIDPNNLPKEGTKVRYSREIDKDYNIPFTEWSGMKIGDETVVMYAGLLFGVRDIYNKFPNSKFVSCSDYPSRFDMWVEDDE